MYEKRKALKKARIDDAKKTKKDVWKGGVIIDLGFDDMMRDPVSSVACHAFRSQQDGMILIERKLRRWHLNWAFCTLPTGHRNDLSERYSKLHSDRAPRRGYGR